jgi:hypothetical protein
VKARQQVRSRCGVGGVIAMFAAGLMAQSVQAANPPWCGPGEVDFGDGFHALLTMEEGSPTFWLTYDVPGSSAAVRDAVLAAAPVQVTFGRVDAPHGAMGLLIGYANLDLRDLNGHRLEPEAYRLECGEGAALTRSIKDSATRSLPPGPDHIPGIFYPGDRPGQELPALDACFRELQQAGRFRFSMSRQQGDPPILVLEGAWPLRAAVERVRALWRTEMERARLGECRIRPQLPPVN